MINKQKEYVAEVGTFNGNNVLTLKPSDAKEFSKFTCLTFGASKAKMILANMDNIREFVAHNEALVSAQEASKNAEKIAKLEAKLAQLKR